ncbi:MBL fold metallo-hydrolase [Brevundimonas sp. Leaf363]|nr:MBL fold metallo-hydrolase [Brevundimonas sp. Leaf363]
MPALLAATLSACASPMTHHALTPADLGVPAAPGALEASLTQPGVITLTRIAFAEWTAGRGAFIDREDPRTAATPKGQETATIYAYVIDHPTRGRFLIDSGVSADLESRLNPVMRRGVHDLSVRVERTTAQVFADQTPPRAVFLTHLHFDHIGGLIDLNPTTPVYVGQGDARDASRINTLLGSPADAILRGHGPLREWRFQPDPSGAFNGVLDIFGDGSVWALHVPGHSPGSTAYLVNAVDGPKLVTGDATSTRLNWQGLPQPLSAAARTQADASADRLRRFAAAHPTIEVFLGHQSLDQRPVR